MAKFKVGQMVRIVGTGRNTRQDRMYVGRVCTVLDTYIDSRGKRRYEIDIPTDNPRSVRKNLTPWEELLAPVNDPPAQEKTTWEEFLKLTGCDPRKEPARVS